jgi:hypothetical protein
MNTSSPARILVGRVFLFPLDILSSQRSSPSYLDSKSRLFPGNGLILIVLWV